jgi:hypothetical protein
MKGSTFSTVRRNILKLRDNKLLTIGEPKKRKAMRLELTTKGLATLLLEGDLQDEELVKMNEKIFQNDFGNLLTKKAFFLLKPVFADVFSKSLLEIRPKYNLKFFDEKWFHHIYHKTLETNIARSSNRYHREFEKKGIWLSKEESDKEALAFLGNMPQELFDKLPKKTKSNFDKLRKKYPEFKVSRDE